MQHKPQVFAIKNNIVYHRLVVRAQLTMTHLKLVINEMTLSPTHREEMCFIIAQRFVLLHVLSFEVGLARERLIRVTILLPLT